METLDCLAQFSWCCAAEKVFWCLLKRQFKINPDNLFFSALFMPVTRISDMSVCVGCSNLHSINTFSNVTSLMTPVPFTFHLTYSPICSWSSALLLSSVPFSILARFPNLFLLRDVWMYCVQMEVKCDSGRCFALWPSRRWVSLHECLRVAKHQVLSPGWWLWRLHVMQTSSRVPQVENRLSKWMKTKIQNLRFFHMRKTGVLEKWQMMVWFLSESIKLYFAVAKRLVGSLISAVVLKSI